MGNDEAKARRGLAAAGGDAGNEAGDDMGDDAAGAAPGPSGAAGDGSARGGAGAAAPRAHERLRRHARRRAAAALRRGRVAARRAAVEGWSALRQRGPGQAQFWLMALFLGLAAGGAAILFRLAISQIQTLIYGADDVRLHSTLERTHWAVVVGVPVLGGALVGWILSRFTDDGKARSVAHVIEGAALRRGRVELRAGLASAAASLVTLSTGGSSGREGPVVHLAAVISSWVSERIRATPMTARDLMGCAVAAAVSASFNAPIAGALFAQEVILRHFALHAYAPIVIASIAGAALGRATMGNVTEFVLPPQSLSFYQELPAFLLLGLVCGLTAVALMRAIFLAEDVGDRAQALLRIPAWARPAAAGLLLGLIALRFPHIIGVGYETTSRALTGALGLREAVLFAVVKAAAVAITFGGRMGGGVFSPSLMMGALTGLAFGTVAVALFPAMSGGQTLYALAGMGAVAAAVLGAPISTTLIVFELTGDWQAGLAVMASVSLSTLVASRMVDRSFFLTQLERRNLHLAEGPHRWAPATIAVRDVMRLAGAEDGPSLSAAQALIEQGAVLRMDDTLERALPMFARHSGPMLPVVAEGEDGRPELIGAVFHLDALRAYVRVLEENLREEHG
ncbi:CIC family chloride channel protein [Oceanicella actignis]|nr:CIC family chloride channel protein [Oceanicella actignis]